MRELWWMAEGRRRHDWEQTGHQLTMLANVNRDHRRRRRPFHVAEFVPRDLRKYFRPGRTGNLTKASLHALKPLFKKDE